MHHKLKHELSKTELLGVVRHRFGNRSRLGSVTRCRGGLFNTTYKIKVDRKPFILRVEPIGEKPRLWLEGHLLQREISITAVLGKNGIPVPPILFSDFSKRVIPRGYVISTLASGHNWYYWKDKISPEENARLYAELGSLAVRIHAIQNPEGVFGYPRPFKSYPQWGDFFVKFATELEADMHRCAFDPLPPELAPAAFAKKMKPILNKVSRPLLVHGDLWQRNVLIEKNNGHHRISALLDCDRAVWGDPWFEWVLYGGNLDAPFWKKYGRNPPKRGDAFLRFLLYRSCGALQASLEQALHFRNRKEATFLMNLAVKDFQCLENLLH